RAGVNRLLNVDIDRRQADCLASGNDSDVAVHRADRETALLVEKEIRHDVGRPHTDGVTQALNSHVATRARRNAKLTYEEHRAIVLLGNTVSADEGQRR